MAWLLDPEPFLTRAACGGGWHPWLVAVHVVGNLLVFLAYVGIPVVLFRLWRWIRTRPGSTGAIPVWTNWAFALFILSCGVGHLFDVLVFWWAPYRLFGFWGLLTGVVSLATLAALQLSIRGVMAAWDQELQEKAALVRAVTSMRRELESLRGRNE